MIEVEAKLATPSGAVLDAIAARDDIAGLRPEPKPLAELETIYLETPGGALRTARAAVRIRRAGASFELTVKAGGDRSGEIHRRSEWTAPLPAVPPFPWAGTPELRERLADVPLDGPFAPTVATLIRRRAIDLRDASGRLVAEIDLDEVRFRSFVGKAGESPVTYEVEIELRSGDEGDLARIVGALRRDYPLEPARFSKLERALRWAGLER